MILEYLHHKNVLFTGGTSGIGRHAVQEIAKMGAKVIIPYRNQEKADKLQLEYDLSTMRTKKGRFDFYPCDFNSMASVIEMCDKVSKKYLDIDIIVHNAGIMNFDSHTTDDDIEATFQVNLLVPLLITEYLMPNLKRGEDAKIIFSASGLHQGDINFEDPEFKKKFSSLGTYRQSKLAVILLARLYAESLKEYNITSYSQHPGMVRTELGRTASWFARTIFYLMGKKPEKGAESLIYLVENPQKFLTNGEYYVDKRVKVLKDITYDLEKAKQVYAMAYTYVQEFLPNRNPSITL